VFDQVFENYIFHVGPSATFEMRVFSQTGLMTELEQAGFVNIKMFGTLLGIWNLLARSGHCRWQLVYDGEIKNYNY
jgi:hypothetical protein